MPFDAKPDGMTDDDDDTHLDPNFVPLGLAAARIAQDADTCRNAGAANTDKPQVPFVLVLREALRIDLTLAREADMPKASKQEFKGWYGRPRARTKLTVRSARSLRGSDDPSD